MEVAELYKVAVIALAVSAISVTVARGGVFEKQRIWLHKRNRWLGGLMSCSYCLSHWVSMALIGIYQPTPIQLWFPLDLILSVFMTVAIAAIVTGIITRLIIFSPENEDGVTALIEALDEAKRIIKER